MYAPNVVGALLSLAQVGAFTLYSSSRWKGAAGAGGVGGGGHTKRPSLSEFLLESAPHGAGSSPTGSLGGSGGGQHVTLL